MSIRAVTRITAYRDGPLLVRGPVTLLEASGKEIAARRKTAALCRCGKSKLRPFCDGTHKLIGFSAPAAPAEDRPAIAAPARSAPRNGTLPAPSAS